MMEAMIKITIDADSINAIEQAIVAILGSGQDQATLQKALDVFMQASRVTDTTISNNLFLAGDNIDEEMVAGWKKE